ncbi:unnamed protein product [Lasius platythorax]|uniref:Uncharacterized protein n=1 Tax=Lasius platythorax TaxID=488582 RepID=A0AAV2NKF8_9HYME
MRDTIGIRDHEGPFKVQIRINREKALKNRGKNAQKILHWLVMKLQICPSDVIMVSHMAEVRFMNYQDANKCLDALEQTNSENDLSARIEARSLTCKGVVTDWPEGIPDFWECIARTTRK